jgi:hypothetical protein
MKIFVEVDASRPLNAIEYDYSRKQWKVVYGAIN